MKKVKPVSKSEGELVKSYPHTIESTNLHNKALAMGLPNARASLAADLKKGNEEIPKVQIAKFSEPHGGGEVTLAYPPCRLSPPSREGVEVVPSL